MGRKGSVIYLSTVVGLCLVVIFATTIHNSKILQSKFGMHASSYIQHIATAKVPSASAAQQFEHQHHSLEFQHILTRLNHTEQRLARAEQLLHESTRMSCLELMSRPNSPYADGSFITRTTTPHTWIPRSDGSRELDRTSTCTLHRYTASEARQCLVGRHLSMVGDSLTRYQYMSLVHFIDTGKYPPRFPRPGNPRPDPKLHCQHLDHNNQSQCSPHDEPNICMEGDWWKQYGEESWFQFYSNIGSRRGIFGGRMECDCVRDGPVNTENKIYVSTPVKAVDSAISPTENISKSTRNNNRVILSNFQEIGRSPHRQPLQGFGFTNCAYNGSCQLTRQQQQDKLVRGTANNFTWQQSFEDAILLEAGHNGTFHNMLPPVDYAVYNRGLWGQFTEKEADIILPRMYDWTGKGTGRCLYKATTADGKPQAFYDQHQHERRAIQAITLKAGCSFLDFGHLTQDFAEMPFQFPFPPTQEAGNLSSTQERIEIFWDKVHFYPWVYEELNNVLLNVLCNWKGTF